jgi:hypothetical protein
LSVVGNASASLNALGAALIAIEQQPVLRPENGRAADDGRWSARLVEQSLTIAETSSLWRMFRVPYRASVALEVTVTGLAEE